jgi:hypothetical protein
VLPLEDGELIRPSAKIVEWAAANAPHLQKTGDV